MNDKLVKYLVTFCGAGLAQKYQGTIGSFFSGSLWFAFIYIFNPNIFILIFIIILTSILAYRSIKRYQINAVNKDPDEIVIDEAIGMFISLLGLSFFPTIKYFIIAFILFRVFDYFKPSIIYRFQIDERDSSIMADDIIAGLFTLLLMLPLGVSGIV